MRDQITNEEIEQLENHIDSIVKNENDDRKKIIDDFMNDHKWVTKVHWTKYKFIDLFRKLFGEKAFNHQMIYKHIRNGIIRTRTKKYLELVKKVML